jgi:hypothetical protein
MPLQLGVALNEKCFLYSGIPFCPKMALAIASLPSVFVRTSHWSVIQFWDELSHINFTRNQSQWDLED